ncbi:MAG: hypothetical protein IKL90_05885 [Alphaproteobacteria bacterium]|nr:hypothetical protein [Alphaproteobacteria bacterium]
MDTQETEIIMEATTDWWMFGATIFAGVLTAIVTFIAVWYTNKKTVELYEKDKEYQNRRNNMVIIKPTIKMGSFFGIIEELILLIFEIEYYSFHLIKMVLIFLMIMKKEISKIIAYFL